ncbi:MAG: hypothetical protein M3R00_00075 [Pseudomonadota bacterium]|nr:hypothetical protein [Pseudomonadota bacterium]
MSFGNWLIAKIGRWLRRNTAPSRSYLCDFDRIRYELRPGDVLLIEGRNHISNVIKQVTQSPWTHSALYIGRLHDIDDPSLRTELIKFYKGQPDNQLIIESVLGKGTVVTDFNYYKNEHIRICRPQGLTRTDAQKVTAFAIQRLGREYDIRHIFDLFRFLFPWALLPRQWRSSIFETNAQKPTHDICSSMIAEAFASVKFPILPILVRDTKKGIQIINRNPKLFTPSDFDYSPYFHIIKYPFLDIAGRTSYSELPWKEEELVKLDQNDFPPDTSKKNN